MIASGLLFFVTVLLSLAGGVVACILCLIRGLSTPVRRETGPTCGRCGYGVDFANTKGMCTECGAELARVGVYTRRAFGKLRAGPVQLYAAWTYLAALFGGVLGYGTLLTSVFAGGMFVAGAGPAGLTPMTTTFTGVLDPIDPASGYRLAVDAAADYDFSTAATTGAIEFVLDGDASSPTLAVDLGTKAWVIRGVDGVETARGPTLDVDAIAAFFTAAGLSTEAPGSDREMAVLFSAVTLSSGQPVDIQTDLTVLPVDGGAPAFTAAGPFASTVTGGPMAMVTAGMGWGLAAAGLWVVTYAGGLIAIVWRRAQMLRA